MKTKSQSAIALALAACLCSAVGCKDKVATQPTLSEGEFLIEGQLPAEKFDSACLYLVPMQGPHPRPVDSVFIGKDGKFAFQGNVEQMAVLRLSWRQRFGIQDLLVVTEPGITHVTLDSVSSSYGTPQNEALQRWKEHREASSLELRQLHELRKRLGNNDQEYQEKMAAYRTAEGEYNYNFLKEMGRNTLTIFLNKMFSGSIDSLRRAELNEMLIDTVDYSKPQVGFHR